MTPAARYPERKKPAPPCPRTFEVATEDVEAMEGDERLVASIRRTTEFAKAVIRGHQTTAPQG